MDPSDSALISDDLMCGQRRISISPQDTRSTREHGRGSTLLHYGFQKWILAGLYGPRVAAIYHIHSCQPRLL